MNDNNYYRPEWTCGRYNAEKRAAIMYNLIAGFSYYFEDYSACVIGEVLKSKKNEEINIFEIESSTGISIDSLTPFFETLMQCGLLTNTVPTTDGIKNYRQAVFEAKKADLSWVEKSTKEKLPMEITNAEQAYFSAVDDGKTICSCMFELLEIVQRLVIEEIIKSCRLKTTSASSMTCTRLVS